MGVELPLEENLKRESMDVMGSSEVALDGCKRKIGSLHPLGGSNLPTRRSQNLRFGGPSHSAFNYFSA